MILLKKKYLAYVFIPTSAFPYMGLSDLPGLFEKFITDPSEVYDTNDPFLGFAKPTARVLLLKSTILHY